MLLVYQHISEPGLSLIHVYESLIGVFHRTLFKKWLDVLLGGQLKHLSDLIRRPYHGPTQLPPTYNQSTSGHGDHPVVRVTNLDQGTV
jgi:hypothetical protein